MDKIIKNSVKILEGEEIEDSHDQQAKGAQVKGGKAPPPAKGKGKEDPKAKKGLAGKGDKMSNIAEEEEEKKEPTPNELKYQEALN